MRNHRRLILPLVAALAAVAVAVPSAQSRVAERYAGPHLGDDNLPAGCVRSASSWDPANRCFHGKVGLNGLDSPSIDVAILAAASPGAERDRRIMKQAVEAWEGGIHYLAGEMGLDWLRDGVKFNITVDEVATNPDGSLAEPLKLVDPEIVVLATSPVGGAGIGADPSWMAGELGITDGEGVPCVAAPAQPFSMDAWRASAGMDDHHGAAGGTYVEDCQEGVGGNVCFAVNAALDPVPGETDLMGMFDLVTHEVGHCLSLGHVGDGSESSWGPIPRNDIMAYSFDPPGITKCVSTLNVEGFAIRMSHYLDVNGDGQVNDADHLAPNDPVGIDGDAVQVQNPADHWYASATGDVMACPQPDLGAIPGTVTNWEPTPVATTKPVLSVPTISTNKAGDLRVQGSALRVPINQPTATSGSVTDATGDVPLPDTDILGLTANVTATTVDAVLKVDGLAPANVYGVGLVYALQIDDKRFDAFLDDNGVVRVVDPGNGRVMPAGTATFDTAASTVSFHIPRDYLASRWSFAPYSLFGQTGTHEGKIVWFTYEDRGPDTGSLELAGPESVDTTSSSATASPSPAGTSSVASVARTVELTRAGGNTFTPADTSAGQATGTQHVFTLPIDSPAKVTITLGWDDATSDMDLYVTGGATAASTGSKPEAVTLPVVTDDLTITVDPYLITGIPTTYTLTATIEGDGSGGEPGTDPNADTDLDTLRDGVDACPADYGPVNSDGCPDTDRDTMIDRFDRCPQAAGAGMDGCPLPGGERIVLLVDGKQVRSMFIDTRRGRYDFEFLSHLSGGRHTVNVVWYAGGEVVASVSAQVRR